jgi:cyclohexanone monooxygenase
MTPLSAEDVERIRTRYDMERRRRLRPDGRSQYVAPEGEFSHYVEGPYIGEVPRAAQTRDVDVVVIDGGFGGILTAGNLRRQGVYDKCLIEMGGDFRDWNEWRLTWPPETHVAVRQALCCLRFLA